MRPKRNPVNQPGDRNLECTFYGRCLDFAVQYGWQHWNCGQCFHKSKKLAVDAVRTVPDTSVHYEIPSGLPRRFYERFH
jgi:hypothetical protein